MEEHARQGRRFLRAAGVSAWVISGVPAVLMVSGWFHVDGEQLTLSPRAFALWASAALAFGISFWITSGQAGRERPSSAAVALLATQTVAALAMYDLVCTGLETMLLVVVAAQLGLFVRLPYGVLWVVLQTACLAWLGHQHWGLLRGVGWALVIGLPTETLAMFTSYFAASQARARHALARANAELRATQEIVIESRQMAERARISRELHDILGHHLSALALNLEAARHQAGDAAREPIERSQDLTRQLLGDVREAVRNLRAGGAVNLARVLEPLVADIPRPRVHLEVPAALEVADPARAQALVRCVQEIVTNAVRHSGADNLWIRVFEDAGEDGDRLRVEGRDDGRGAKALEPGRGLLGMRERLERLGGTVVYESPREGGFRVDASLPALGTAS